MHADHHSPSLASPKSYARVINLNRHRIAPQRPFMHDPQACPFDKPALKQPALKLAQVKPCAGRNRDIQPHNDALVADSHLPQRRNAFIRHGCST